MKQVLLFVASLASSCALAVHPDCLKLMLLAAEMPENPSPIEALSAAFAEESSPSLRALSRIIQQETELPDHPVNIPLILENQVGIVEALVPGEWLEFAKFYIRDGYITEVEISAEDFISWGDEILDRFPIRHLRINAKGNARWADFFQLPFLSQLHSLSLLRAEMGRQGVTHLVECPYLSQLQELRLIRTFTSLRRKAASYLIKHAYFPSLRRLDLVHNDLSNEQFEKLLQSNGFPSLRELDVSYNSFYRLYFDQMESLRLLENLEHLNLADTSLDRFSFPNSAESFPRLRSINFAGNHRLNINDFALFLQQPWVSRLDALGVVGTPIQNHLLLRYVEVINARH